MQAIHSISNIELQKFIESACAVGIAWGVAFCTGIWLAWAFYTKMLWPVVRGRVLAGLARSGRVLEYDQNGTPRLVKARPARSRWGTVR